jgi:hypothetical protein
VWRLRSVIRSTGGGGIVCHTKSTESMDVYVYVYIDRNMHNIYLVHGPERVEEGGDHLLLFVCVCWERKNKKEV